MLLIPTYLDRSSIAGVGLFTSEFVKKGTPLWEYHPLMDIILTQEQFDELPDIAYDFVDRVAVSLPYGADNYWLSFDSGNYVNHSDTPNAEGSDPGIALIDIPAYTEITIDYYKADHRTEPSDVGR